MTLVILVCAALIFTAGLVMLFKPGMVFDFMRDHAGNPGLLLFAVGVRLMLGSLLVLQSSQSKYPLVIEIFGYLSLAAAFFLILIGRERFTRLVSRVMSFVQPLGRVGSLGALAFAVFLIHAFV